MSETPHAANLKALRHPTVIIGGLLFLGLLVLIGHYAIGGQEDLGLVLEVPVEGLGREARRAGDAVGVGAQIAPLVELARGGGDQLVSCGRAFHIVVIAGGRIHVIFVSLPWDSCVLFSRERGGTRSDADITA
jgi:hypothetical protein